MTIEFLKENGLILFETIAGSRAYGTNIPTSDTDIRGVFILPQDYVLTKYGMKGAVDQVDNSTNDITYYELGKFLKLIESNNPNILELLNSPEDCIQYQHSLWNLIIEHKEKFITKICRKSFGGYAAQQISKARGLNKKVFKPMEKEKKTILDFCYFIKDEKSIPLKKYFEEKGYDQKFCGLSKVPHARDLYALFFDNIAHNCFSDKLSIEQKGFNKNNYLRLNIPFGLGFKGICLDDSNEIRLSQIPKNLESIGNIVYNKDNYTVYCKEYTEYWNWVKDRNPDRYEETVSHGNGYDAKNIMHCHRLLDVSIEIAQGKGINVRRPNREELLNIRKGLVDYDIILNSAMDKIKAMDEIFENSDLPDFVDSDLINSLILKIRKEFYMNKSNNL